MGKNPAFQFYVKDWLSDPQLRMCSHSTKGIWIDLLCLMWEAPSRGELEGTEHQIRKMVGAENGDFQVFLQEASALRFCYAVTDHNKKITLRNRRMYREAKDQDNNRLRQQKYRDKHKSNGDVTPPSPSPSPLLGTNVPNCPQKNIVDLWHVTLPELPKIKIWDETRQSNLRARWKEDETRQNIEWWQRFFEYFRKCPFLMGEVPPTNGRKQFYATLDWAVTRGNFIKIIEGRYEEK